MQNVPFYAEISRHIQKRFTTDIPTMAVSFDPKADELVMWVNPYFAGGGTYVGRDGKPIVEAGLSNTEITGCLTHEFDHIVFGHLNARRLDPPQECNIAQDLAINSLIVSNTKLPVGEKVLPDIVLIPGKRPHIDPVRFAQLTDWQKKASTKLADLIEKFPPLKATEWYFKKILEDAKKNGYEAKEIAAVIGTVDSHDGWDDAPDDTKEYIEGKVKAIIEKAVRHADSQKDGWGNIPADIREEIRRSISTIINWRNVLRQFVGKLVRGSRATSIKRINKRYPYIHPGIKRGYTAKLLIAIDESGSVNDEMLEMFFAELESLTKKVDVTLLHFDCSCSMKDLYEWKKGTRPKLKRMKGGSTDFDAPTRLANDPKNRGRWDGMLIMTDGCAPAPNASRIRRGWILGQGCQLNFSSNEAQIFLTKERPMSGAWR